MSIGLRRTALAVYPEEGLTQRLDALNKVDPEKFTFTTKPHNDSWMVIVESTVDLDAETLAKLRAVAR